MQTVGVSKPTSGIGPDKTFLSDKQIKEPPFASQRNLNECIRCAMDDLVVLPGA